MNAKEFMSIDGVDSTQPNGQRTTDGAYNPTNIHSLKLTANAPENRPKLPQ